MSDPTPTTYDEFSLFHENAEEVGLPFEGPPTVRRESLEVAPGRQVSALVWGDAPAVHMALLDDTSSDIAVLSYICEDGTYPSVGARHPPAIRLERAIRDLYGLDAIVAPDARTWLDLGFWDVRHPLGNRTAARKPEYPRPSAPPPRRARRRERLR